MYIMTHVLQCTYIVELTSAFTHLVFQHSLRIRFKSAETKEEEKNRDNANAKMASSSSEANLKGVSKGVAKFDSKSRSDTDSSAGRDATPAGENQTKERAVHLIGKINNLLTTDVSIIVNSLNAVEIRASLDLYTAYSRH